MRYNQASPARAHPMIRAAKISLIVGCAGGVLLPIVLTAAGIESLSWVVMGGFYLALQLVSLHSHGVIALLLMVAINSVIYSVSIFSVQVLIMLLRRRRSSPTASTGPGSLGV